MSARMPTDILRSATPVASPSRRIVRVDLVSRDSLPTDWNCDIAFGKPVDRQRVLGISDGFIADILPRAVVDLLARVFNDLQDCYDIAPRLHLMTHQTHALEVQALTFAGRQ